MVEKSQDVIEIYISNLCGCFNSLSKSDKTSTALLPSSLKTSFEELLFESLVKRLKTRATPKVLRRYGAARNSKEVVQFHRRN